MAYYWTAFDWVAYEKKTAHLSVTQHGAYFLMLKHYYQTSKPLPPNTDTILRVCRAFSDVERDAVMSVLNEFFILEDDGYHNPKADEELSKSASMMQAKSKGGQARASMLDPERRSEIAREAANARWKTKDLQDSIPASMPAGCLQDALQLQSQIQLHNNNINTTAEVAEKPSKRRRTQKDIIAGFSEATKSVVNKAIEIWPTVRPGNNSPVRIDTAKLADRVDGLLKQPGIDADILLEAANMYLAEKKEFLHAPEYFFGPGKNAEDPPWRPYARMAYHNRNLSKAQVAQ